VAERAPPPPFLVDHMLAKLGAYLRCIGLDAASSALLRRELLQHARVESRVLLTRSPKLAGLAPPDAHVFRVEDADPVRQLWAVVRAFDIDPRARLFTRCIRCNVELALLEGRGEWTSRVPPRVLERHARFWTCPACGTIFWRGTHVANTCAKLGIVSPEDT